MISATPLKSVSSLNRYYVSEHGDAGSFANERGVWSGKGAGILGLVGQVERKEFLALSMNMFPVTGKRLTARTSKNRRVGYDVCFDVPKSVSIYLAETNDKVVERLIQEAFKETMAKIEKNMQTRERGSDNRRTTGNIVYASFVHRLSRPVRGQIDPQYHIHAFVFNSTYDEIEKRWKAGEFGPIVTQMPDFEKMFNEKLMTKFNAIGMRIRRTAHAFELDGITRTLIEKFSKRWKQIGDTANRLHRKILNSMRERKSNVRLDEDELRRDWRSQMTEEERKSLHDTYRHSMIHRSVMCERMIPRIYEPYRSRSVPVVTRGVRAQDRSVGIEKRVDIPGMDRG